MLERIKVLAGLGDPAVYGQPSMPWRLALVAVQVVFVVLLLVANSWANRAVIVVAVAAAMALLALASQRSVSRSRT